MQAISRKLSLLLIVSLLLASVSSALVPRQALAATGSADLPYLLADFEEQTLDNSTGYWFGSSGDGVTYSFGKEVGDAEEGQGAAKLAVDFTQPSGLAYFSKAWFDSQMKDVKRLAFWVKQTGLNSIYIKLKDSTGEVFQQQVKLDSANPGWQQVVIDHMDSANYWGGDNNGVWNGPLNEVTFLVDRWSVQDGSSSAVLLVDQLTAEVADPPQEPVDFGTRLTGFEENPLDSSTGYQAGKEGEGVAYTFDRATGPGQSREGEASGQLTADFTLNTNESKGFVYASKEWSADQWKDVKKLAFWVKATHLDWINIRLVDSSGEVFQQRVNLDRTNPGWQQVVIDQLSSDNHWGGDINGEWNGPLREIQWIVDYWSIPAGEDPKGELLIDNVTAEVPPPDESLVITQSQLGNVFTEGEPVQFGIRTEGTELTYTVSDIWGNPVRTGDLAVSAGQSTLVLSDLDKGYYELNVTAKKDGVKFKETTTAFAILGPLLNLTEIQDSPFGVSTHFPIWPQDTIDLVRKAGIKHIRDEIYWSAVENHKGEYGFPAVYQNYMARLKAASIDPLIIFSYNNSLYDEGYTPYTDEGRAAFAQYGNAVVNQFEDQIKSVEVYNEFDHIYSTGTAATDKPLYYYELLKKTYETVKSGHPDVQVGGPVAAGLPWDYLENVFKLGGLPYMDAVTVHPYRFPGPPEGIDNEIGKLQAMIKQYNGGQSKPIWTTEFGWPTHQGGTGVSEEDQAANLVRSMVLLLSKGVERMYWYDLMNDGTVKTETEHNFGLIRNAGDDKGAFTPKPAYVSYAAMTRELTGAQFTGAENIGSNLYSYLFQSEGQPLRVVWSTGGPVDVSILTETPIVITDMLGRKETYVPHNGKVAYTLTKDPIYVRGDVEIATGSPVKVETARAMVGQPVSLKVSVDNRDSALPAEVQVSALGHNAVFTAAAGELASATVDLEGYQAEGVVTIPVEVKLNGATYAYLLKPVTIVQPTKVEHIVRDGIDKLAIRTENPSSSPITLETVDWTIGSETGTTSANLTIDGVQQATYELALPALGEGTYPYRITAHFAGGAVSENTGVLRLMDNSRITDLYKQTVAVGGGLDASSSPPTIDLFTQGNYANAKGSRQESNLSGKVWINWDQDAFYLSADIVDDVHYQVADGGSVWQGDSIQFALSTGNPGETAKTTEFGVSLTQHGPELYRWTAINALTTGLVSGANVSVTRDEASGHTRYELALPWSELAPILPEEGALYAFSMLVNDNDGNADGRGWVEWGAGIGNSKDSSLFNPIRFAERVTPEKPGEEKTGNDPSSPSAAAPSSPVAANPGTVKDGVLSLNANWALNILKDAGKAQLQIDLTDVAGDEGGSKAVVLPQEVVAKAKEAGKPLVLLDKGVEWTLPPDGLKTDRSLTLSIAAADAPSLGVAGVLGKASYRLTAKSGDTVLNDAGGDMTMKLPIPKGTRDADMLVVYRKADDGARLYAGGRPSGGKLTIQTRQFGEYGVGESTKTFPDIANHWSRRAVEVLAARQIVQGLSEDRFAPNAPLTRAEFAALLARSLKLNGGKADFPDVTNGEWFAGAVGAAQTAGLLAGDGGSFRPFDVVTREEMAVLLMRAYQKAGGAAGVDGEKLPPYYDAAAVADWAKKAVAKAYGVGILTGYADGNFAPAGKVSRAEAITALLRLMDKTGL